MPTTSRLVAALLLAAVGWVVADLIKPYLTEGLPTGLFSPISAGFGLIIGWRHTGRKLQERQGTAWSVGLTSGLLLVFWVLLSFSGYEMYKRAIKMHYDGRPTAAVQDMFAIAVDYLKTAAQVDVIAALVIGILLVGVVTDWVAKRFR